jgi:hypothetical protein
MPYVSRSQQGFFHTPAGKKKVGPEVVKEFDNASRGQTGLPEHVVKKFAGRAAKKSIPSR